jgi:hypothetical protein
MVEAFAKEYVKKILTRFSIDGSKLVSTPLGVRWSF